MKQLSQLPDDKVLNQLIKLAENAEIKAKNLCDLAREIDYKWRKRLEDRRKKQLETIAKLQQEVRSNPET